MAAPGANLSGSSRGRMEKVLLHLLGLKPNGLSHNGPPTADGTSSAREIALLSKTNATAPTTNTAADAPTGKGDLCLHFNAAGTIQGLYRCTAYTSTSVFTWAQIA